MPVLTTLALAWGTLSFGAVYPWAYWPLIVVTAALGIGMLVRRGPEGARFGNTRLAAALAVVACAVILQCLPLPRSVVAAISPGTDTLLAQYDLRYASPPDRAPASTMEQHSASAGSWHTLSVAPGSTRLALTFLGAFGVLFVALTRAARGRSVFQLAHGIVALGTVVALIGILQHSVSPRLIYGLWQPLARANQAFGPFVNRNHFAGWMAMSLSLGLGLLCGRIAQGMKGVRPGWRERLLWFGSKEANQAILIGVGSIIMALSLVMTTSRSGIAGLAMAVCFSAWAIGRAATSRRRQWFAFGYLTLLVVVAFSATNIDTVATRFLESPEGRLAPWRDAIRVIRDFWPAGTGLNTYTVASLFYQTADPRWHFTAAHNDYLQLLAEGGLLVAVPAAVAVWLLMVEVRKRFRERRDEDGAYWLRVGAVAGLGAIGMQEIVDFSLQIPANALLFVLLAAVTVHRPVEKVTVRRV